MNRYLYLSAILLLSILESCSDRDEDVDRSVEHKSVIIKSEEARKLIFPEPCLNKSEYLHETRDKESIFSRESGFQQETIDPTKPDRPK
ncbi:hypothetical protein [Chryseobacterium nematophagum]|uniref:hypothetical protein n=1 Tax=Chryseobacterium nematophagum TaxID=2305228 RepID=UPI0011C3AA87|nr:hypothetical protein [Chryseobacterium nematophagum]